MAAPPKSGTHDTHDHGAQGKDRDAAKKLDDELDEALEESFPASDPASIVQPPHSRQDKEDS